MFTKGRQGSVSTEPTVGNDDRKAFVDKQLADRYRPREVREIMAKYGDNMEVALEHAIQQNNEVVQRLMRKQAELEFDLLAAQQSTTASKAQVDALTAERDGLRTKLDGLDAAERAKAAERLLSERFKDAALVLRHKAYLLMDGYKIEVDGEGDRAQLMLVKGDKRQRFDTVVNDEFYARYADARPTGDDPLSNPGAPAAQKPISDLGAEFYANQDKAAFPLIPTAAKG